MPQCPIAGDANVSVEKLWVDGVYSAAVPGSPQSLQHHNPLSLRSVSVTERGRSASENPDDERAATDGMQTTRQMSVSCRLQVDNVPRKTDRSITKSYKWSRNGVLLMMVE